MVEMLIGSYESGGNTLEDLWFQAGMFKDGNLSTLRFVRGTHKDFMKDETIRQVLERIYLTTSNCLLKTG